MKKVVVVLVAVAVIGLLGTMGYAARQGAADGQVDVGALRQLQKETLPLRDEIMAKGLELRNEYNKETPDQNRIAKLGTEMAGLRTQIQAAAEKQGVPAFGYGPGMGRGWGSRMMGWGYGRGPGFRGGPGFGGGPGPGGNCPMWQ